MGNVVTEVKKEVQLCTDGLVKMNGREYTRLVGGFNNDNPVISDLQIANILEYKHGARQVRQRVNENVKHFTFGVDIIDIKSNYNFYKKILIDIGYSIQSINLSKHIYLFSHSGFIKFCIIVDMKQNIQEFEKKYFYSNNLYVSLCRFETAFGKILKETYKDIINFIPQYICCNNKYRIDFYDPKYKLAIEYDEEHHNYQQKEDRKREKEIHDELDCNFVRVKKGQKLKGINKINKYILNFNIKKNKNKYDNII